VAEVFTVCRGTDQSINQSINHSKYLYSAMCRKRIGGLNSVNESNEVNPLAPRNLPCWYSDTAHTGDQVATTLCPTKAPRRGVLSSRPRPAFKTFYLLVHLM